MSLRDGFLSYVFGLTTTNSTRRRKNRGMTIENMEPRVVLSGVTDDGTAATDPVVESTTADPSTTGMIDSAATTADVTSTTDPTMGMPSSADPGATMPTTTDPIMGMPGTTDPGDPMSTTTDPLAGMPGAAPVANAAIPVVNVSPGIDAMGNQIVTVVVSGVGVGSLNAYALVFTGVMNDAAYINGNGTYVFTNATPVTGMAQVSLYDNSTGSEIAFNLFWLF